METVEEEMVYMQTNIFGNVGPVAYSEPLKRPAQTTGQFGSSIVLSFVSDKRGIGSYRRSMEAVEDEELSIEKSIFANVRLAACTEPPQRLVEIVGRAGTSDVLCFASDEHGLAAARCLWRQLWRKK